MASIVYAAYRNSGLLQTRTMSPSARVPYLTRVYTVQERLAKESGFPFTLRFVADLDLRFEHPVTFFVGENGTGNSTMTEAIAALAGLPVSGGGQNDVGGWAPETEAPLARVLRPSFRKKPPDGYFLRAEFYGLFALLLDARHADPGFSGDPYMRYGRTLTA